MIYLVVIALELAVVKWRGGKISRLGLVKFHWSFLLPLGFGCQLLAIYVLYKRPTEWHPDTAYLVGWFLLAIFLIRNIRIPRIQLLSIGAMLNLAAIAANGGTMPMTQWAKDFAGLPLRARYWYNAMPIADAKLWFLGDFMAFPKALGPLANVFSIGDVLILAGFGIFLWRMAFDESLDSALDDTPFKKAA